MTAPLSPDDAADVLVHIAAGRVLAGDPAAALRLLERHGATEPTETAA